MNFKLMKAWMLSRCDFGRFRKKQIKGCLYMKTNGARFKKKHHQQKRGDNPVITDHQAIFLRVWWAENVTRTQWMQNHFGIFQKSLMQMIMVNRTSCSPNFATSSWWFCVLKLGLGIFLGVPPPSNIDYQDGILRHPRGKIILIFRTESFQLSSM